ncbi:MAG: sugar ABC transporter permease [Phycisphaerae bacterium]|nr:sugar ABC transporter permease [Phycisphaerae bacterium]
MGSSTIQVTTRHSADSPRWRLSPVDILRSPWQHRDLISRLGRREIEVRYRGSVLGLFWAIMQPLVLLAVYTFVFGMVFQAKAPRMGIEDAAAGMNMSNFALELFAGLIVFNLFSDCVGRAPSVLRSNITFVKKVVFPLEILPWSTMIMAIFNALVASLVFAIFYAFVIGTPPVTILLVPVIVLPVIIMVFGFSWILMSIGLYVQDTQQVVGLILTVTLFTCPIFYPLSVVPEPWQSWLYINPLTTVIEMLRSSVFMGTAPDYGIWLIYLGASLAIAWIGWIWFMATRRGFADAI